ncbi:energy transducer TonB [Hymenobacter terrestris]|uniref:TonB family protein n=1 Tax=Hymenobacter terrestris TaxID=2748310 RepID=A0ABX2Q1P6_9BACT|nr:energy transducer TonB [Hymenobacter terrestris]NVO83956.1 TonB family protein [Hymenobacter terrestris]
MTARFLMCMLLLSSLSAAAQVVEPYRVPQAAIDVTDLESDYAQSPSRNSHHIGEYAEQMPTFAGGLEGLLCFLYRHNRFAAPSAAYPAGRVFVRFLIDEGGRVRDARLLKPLHPELDAEALRLVRLLSGHFTPGYNNKRPVAVPFSMPVQFPAVVPDKKQLKRCQ